MKRLARSPTVIQLIAHSRQIVFSSFATRVQMLWDNLFMDAQQITR
jgi:hypothetical protein